MTSTGAPSMQPSASLCDRKREAGDPGAEESDKRRKCDDTDVGSGMRVAVEACVEELVCPICHELPVDPVTAEDGRLYERACILHNG